MSLPPPNGYGIASITFQRAGTPHPAVTTMGFRNANAFTAATCLTQWRNATSGSTARPFHASRMMVGWTITEMYVLIMSTLGVPTSAVDTTPIVGTLAGVGMPVNTSIVVNKTVAAVGKQYRGRMLWPPVFVPQANVDGDGNIVAGSVSGLQGFATAMLSTMNSNNIPGYLLHQPPQGGGPTPVPTLISGLVVRSRIGTIRHRIRR